MNYNKVPEWLTKASYRIIEHMNEDHSDSIVSTLNAQHGIKDKSAKMEKLEVNGYFASSKGKSYFLKFGKSCNSSEEYKIELIKHAKKYKQCEL
jgi:putative heme iron utilization protein|tara:strand:- start:159 stop:440 length:282 start_codon:yes stop_codon:yes gene_type:complete